MEGEIKARRKDLLSGDLLYEVLIRLPASSITRLRWTSKLCFAITSNPSFIRSHARFSPSPSFVIQVQRSRRSCLLYPISGNDKSKLAPTRINKPCKSNIKLVANCDYLLCFVEEEGARYHIFDQLTERWITVPREGADSSQFCALYLHPSTGGYRLLSMYRLGKFKVYTLRTKSWRQISNANYVPPLPAWALFPSSVHSFPVSLHGTLHSIGYAFDARYYTIHREIFAFDTNKEEFRQMSYPTNGDGMLPDRLLMIDEEYMGLCKVESAAATIDIWILMDYTREVWMKRYTIPTASIDRPPRGGISLRPLAIQGDGELWIGLVRSDGYWNGFILYNLKLNTFKTVDIDIDGLDGLVGARIIPCCMSNSLRALDSIWHGSDVCAFFFKRERMGIREWAAAKFSEVLPSFFPSL